MLCALLALAVGAAPGCTEQPPTPPASAADDPGDAPPLPDGPVPTQVPELLAEASAVAERLVRDHPQVADAHEIKARIHFMTGRIDDAAASWRRALEINPQSPYAMRGLGLVAMKHSDFEQALQWQQRALSRMPDYAEAAHLAAEAQWKLGDVAGAIETLERHRRNSTQPVATTIRLGQTYLAAHRYPEARGAFNEALKLAEEAHAQYGLALALERLGEHDAASAAMQRYRDLRAVRRTAAIQELSQDWDLNLQRTAVATQYVFASQVYLIRHQFPPAEKLLTRAVALDPASIEGRVLLVSAYVRTGRRDRAAAACRELIELDPANPQWRQLQVSIGYASR